MSTRRLSLLLLLAFVVPCAPAHARAPRPAGLGRLQHLVVISLENHGHPGYADVLTGERRAPDPVRAIMAGPQWDSTAIVIPHDEHGGFRDHVAPQRFERWGPGTRVPALVVAPFARRWDLRPLSRRDAKAAPLPGAFDLRP